MKKQFLVNFSLLLLLNICIKPAWIFGDLMVQRSTGEAYGNYFALFNLTLILNMVLDFGLTNYNNRKVSGNPGQFSSLFKRIVPLRFALSFIYLSLLMVSSLFFSLNSQEKTMLLILGLNQVLLSSVLYFRSNITGLGYFKTDSIISVLDRTVMLILLAYHFVARDGIEILDFVLVQFVAYCFVFTLTFGFMVWKGGRISFKVDWRFAKKCLSQSFPYALIVLLMAGYSYVDSLMMKQMLDNGDMENSIYAQSFRILMAVNNYVYLVAVLLLPMFSKLLKKKELVQPLLRLSGSMVIYAMFTLAIFSLFYSDEVISLLYGKYDDEISWYERFFGSSTTVLSFAEGADVFQVLMLACIPMSFNYIYGVLLTADGKMKILNRIAGAGLLANVLLNFYLIPHEGALGAAMASVLTQSLAAVLQWWFCYREFKINVEYLHLLKFVVAIGILSVIMIYGKHSWEGFTPIILYVISAVILALVLGFVPIKALKQHFMKSQL